MPLVNNHSITSSEFRRVFPHSTRQKNIDAASPDIRVDFKVNPRGEGIVEKVHIHRVGALKY
jgi:hypothetical protein